MEGKNQQTKKGNKYFKFKTITQNTRWFYQKMQGVM
jgi:hypothetical protein